MNYTLVLVGNGVSDNITLGVYFRDPDQRPLIGQQLEYKRKVYKVLSCTPPDNPSTVTVTYFIEPLNINYPYRRPIR